MSARPADDRRDDEGFARAAPIFAALGDQTRLRLVERLRSDGPLSIAHLTAGAGVTRQAVTKHLHVLEDAGLARGARHGREQLWMLEPEPLDEARRYLDDLSQQWDQSLARLKAHVEAEPDPD